MAGSLQSICGYLLTVLVLLAGVNWLGSFSSVREEAQERSLTISQATSQTSTTQGELEGRLWKAIEVLGRVPTGRGLLEDAQQKWKVSEMSELTSFLRWGEVSKTDSILTRHYDPDTGQEQRETQLTIYLRRDQVMSDVVLDLAHELSHAVSKRELDPYDPTLTPGTYIQMAIEGEGGEVQALMHECQVALELRNRFDTPISRCERYLRPGGYQIDRARVLRDFYRVGDWKEKLQAWLGEEYQLLPLLSRSKPQLYSSTGNSPYPVALFEEYSMMTEVACENTQKRVRFARTPARRIPQEQSRLDASRELLRKRCPHQALNQIPAQGPRHTHP